jgi:hypothetical protein
VLICFLISEAFLQSWGLCSMRLYREQASSQLQPKGDPFAEPGGVTHAAEAFGTMNV